MSAPVVFPTIDGYEVREEIGRGGMGVVYLAEQQSPRRPVAIKLVGAGALAGPKELDAFVAEAQLQADVKHHNVVAIHHVGRANGLPYICMEYLRRGSLATELAQRRAANRPPTIAEAVEWTRTLALALSHIHEQGFVHRDLKPGNVLLEEDGTLKVSDFGLARPLRRPADAPSSLGYVKGTPDYMAPEQTLGVVTGVGPAADLYALGVILFELLTGRRPFEGKSDLDVMLQVADLHLPAPSPRRWDRALPRDLEAICLKCLEKTAPQRYAGARELAADLERFQRGEPVQARRAGPLARAVKWCRRRPAAAAAMGLAVSLFAAVAVGLGVVLWQRGELRETNTRLENTVTDLERTIGERDDANRGLRTTIGERDRALAESEDRLRWNYLGNGLEEAGKRNYPGALAWYATVLSRTRDADEKHLHRLRLLGLLRQLPRATRSDAHDEPVQLARYGGKDGRLVLSVTRHRVSVREAATGKKLGDLSHPASIQFAHFRPGHDEVLTLDSDNDLRLWRPGEARPWRARKLKAMVVGDFQFDGTGDRVALLAAPANEAKFRKTVYIWGLKQDTFSELRPGAAFTALAASPTGPHLATTAGREVQLWDLTRPAAPVHTLKHPGEVSVAVFSNRGDRLVTGTGAAARLWNTLTGQQAWNAPANLPGDVSGVTFTGNDESILLSYPTGSVLVQSATGQPVPAVDIDAVGLSHGPGQLSGDRRFTLSVVGRQVRTFDLASALTTAPLIASSRKLLHLGISHDGRRVVTVDGGSIGQVWRAEDGRHLYTHPVHVFVAAFSPRDGQLAVGGKALSCLDERGAEVYRAAAPDGAAQLLAYSDDGRYLAAGGANGQVDLHDLSARKLVWSFRAGEALGALTLSPSGGRLLVSYMAREKDGQPITFLALYDTAGQRLVKALVDGSKRFLPVGSFGAGGRRVIGLTHLGEAQLWDAGTGKELVTLVQPRASAEEGLLSLARLSPDGRTAATLSGRVLHLWDADTGKVNVTITANGTLADASFSPDGRMVVIAGSDRLIQLLDARTGQNVLALGERQQGPVNRVMFSPDGRHVLGLSDGATRARIWNVGDDPTLEDKDLIDLAELEAAQTARSGEIKPLDADWADRTDRRLRARFPQAFATEEHQVSEYHYRQAAEAAKARDWQAGVAHWTRLLEDFGDRLPDLGRAQLHAARGNAHFQLQRLREAEADYLAAMALAPTGNDYREWAGFLQSQQGRYAEALATYTAGVAPQTGQAIGHQGRGHAYASRALSEHPGHWAYAEAHFRAALQAGGLTPQQERWAQRYLALTLVAQKKVAAFDELRRALMKQYANTQDAAEAEVVAWVFCFAPVTDREMRRFLIDLTARVANKRGGNASFTATQASAEYRTNRLSDAHQDMRQAINLYGGPDKIAIEVYPFLAMILHRRYYPAEARRVYEEGLRRLQGARQERSANGLTRRYSWHLLAEWELLLREARAELERPVASIPAEVVVPLPAPAELARRIKGLTARLAATKDHADLTYQRGVARLQLGLASPAEADWAGAAADLAAALKRDDSRPAWWYFTALALLRHGDLKGYDDLCRRAVQKFPPEPGSFGGPDVLLICSLGPNRALPAGDALKLRVPPIGDTFFHMTARYRALNNDPISPKDARRLGPWYLDAGLRIYLKNRTRAVPDVQSWLFLALAKHGIGEKVAAQQWLDQARPEVDKVRRGEAALSWNRWLEVEVLLREAETAIQTKQ